MAIDLKTILADGEILFRNGANPDGFASTAYGRTLLNGATAAATRTLLGLGSVAVATLIDDDTFATATASNVPSAESVKAYVDANAGGDISSTSTTVAPGGDYWDFLVNASDPTTSTDTKLPTWAKVKAYVDALPTLTTSDTGKVPISTVGSVTTIDVDDLLTSTDSAFLDSGLTIKNATDPTKVAAFAAGSITTGTTRTFTFPDASGVLALLESAQTFTGAKTFTGGLAATGVAASSLGPMVLNAAAYDTSVSGSNLQVFGNVLYNASIQFLHDGSSGGLPNAAPAQTPTSTAIMSLLARGHTGSGRPSASQARIQFVTREAVGASWGTAISLATTAIGGTALVSAALIETDQTLRVRSGILTGDTTLSALASGYSVESRSSSGGIGYGVGGGGTVTQGSGSGKATGVTLNRPAGEITMDSASLANNAVASFVLTNSVIAAADVIVVCVAGGTSSTDDYFAWIGDVAAGSCTINVRNVSGGSLSEAVVLNFAVIKGATT